MTVKCLGAPAIWRTHLLDARLPADTYDLIFARWVFLFLPGPGAQLKALVRALKPGGRLAIQDYHRETFVLVPRPPEWDGFMAADRAFFASQGGDASIGTRLPDLYRAAGLEVTSIDTTVKSGHPRSPVWNWLTKYFMGVMDRYTEFPPFDRAQALRVRAAWRRAGAHRASLLIGPALLDVVGRKRA